MIKEPHQDVVLYIHGGAWFQDPLDNHLILSTCRRIGCTVIMPVYPKVPHRDYRTTFELLKIFIKKKY